MSQSPSETIWPVGALLPGGDAPLRKFVVAAYQRGYKWKKFDIDQLLDDVYGFVPARHGEFYCLQPLVVSPRPGEPDCWELIDGQQRMTTIFLILAFLGRPSYDLVYLTRQGSREFLLAIAHADIPPGQTWDEFIAGPAEPWKINNIDNYHFFEARKAVCVWFEQERNRSVEARAVFTDKLLRRTAFIWYPVADEDHKRAFLNLNSGKIPLTESERIKALFLQSDPNADDADAARLRQTEIAQEWDRIEYALQHDDLWLFLNENTTPRDHGTRIDFIFDLLAPDERDGGGDRGLSAYHQYAGWKESLDSQDWVKKWEDAKGCFLTLREWFEDRELYHDLGFLIATGMEDVRGLLDANADKTKKEFGLWIAGRIRDALKECDLDGLRYGQGSDERKLRRVLLLFNIKSLKKEEDARFPFHLYKRERWSLEHIHARHSQPLSADEAWRHWMDGICSHLEKMPDEAAQRLVLDLKHARDASAAAAADNEKPRRDLEERAFKLLGPELIENDVHLIKNLALLSREINSALSNHLFPVKRRLLIEKDAEGKFVPVGTRNVFLKYYSQDFTAMNIWTKRDRELYLERIESVLESYLP